MQLFTQSSRDISAIIVSFTDPKSLMHLSLVNRTAHNLVQDHCLKLIRSTEIIPGFSFDCILPLRSPLWIYTNLVCPFLEARESFQASDPKAYIGNFLTDGCLLSGNYIDRTPLSAVLSYGCPNIFERLLRIRFGVDSREYKSESENLKENKYYLTRVQHRHSSELTTEVIFKQAVSEYERLHIIDGRYYGISRMIAKSQKIDILRRWVELFPTSLYSDYCSNCGVIYMDVASYGSCDMMSYLLSLPLKDGVLLTNPDNGFSLVHYAAAANNRKNLELFSRNGFNLECLDKKGNTPLCAAREHSAEDAVQYFLQLKAADNTMIPEVKSTIAP